MVRGSASGSSARTRRHRSLVWALRVVGALALVVMTAVVFMFYGWPVILAVVAGTLVVDAVLGRATSGTWRW